MPFTPSHVAAVLPLLRTPLPAAALVVGSISPDIPYYLPGARHWPTHTAWAVPTVDLALGALAWVLWHGLLCGAVVHLAPRWVRARLAGRVVVGLAPRVRSARQVALVAAALVVGAATHVLWDDFTHAGRWGTAHVPVLAERWAGLAGYRWAQYAGGVLGAVLVVWWVRRWWRRTPAVAVPVRPRSPLVWGALSGAATAAGVLAALRGGEVRAAVFAGATAGGAALLLGLVLTSLALRVAGRTGG
ncbi:DUF4184 family protein [Kineococcus glutinatus]|uniref:DUF4184 family protein n=1 Tax=Kineococcus glutinatus TaxID=1070872 RepID=UPI0031EBC5AF